MQCPNCKNDMWDNRENKKNPKGPDYKCKDPSCGKAVWLQPYKKSLPVQTNTASSESIRLLRSIDTNIKSLLNILQMRNDPLEKEIRDLGAS